MSAISATARITPFLWFDNNAEEAVAFYLTVFRNSRRLDLPSSEAAPHKPGSAFVTIPFELDGQHFVALNGGPMFTFTEAVSFVIHCADQDEVDFYWTRLAEGGSEGRCGWLKDRFGLSWQVVPTHALDLLRHPKARQRFLSMTKFEIAELERAASEETPSSEQSR